MDTKESNVKVKGELRGPNTERNGFSCECFESSAQGGEFLVDRKATISVSRSPLQSHSARDVFLLRKVGRTRECYQRSQPTH